MNTIGFIDTKSLKLKLLSIVTVCLLITSTEIKAQSNTNLPDNIYNSFQQKYPGYKVKSCINKDNQFIVKFLQQHQYSSAVFSADGKWINTQTPIKSTRQLSDAIREAFNKSKYASWYIVNIIRCEYPGASPFYRFTVNNSNLLDGDHHDAFLKTYSLDVADNHVAIANE